MIAPSKFDALTLGCRQRTDQGDRLIPEACSVWFLEALMHDASDGRPRFGLFTQTWSDKSLTIRLWQWHCHRCGTVNRPRRGKGRLLIRQSLTQPWDFPERMHDVPKTVPHYCGPIAPFFVHLSHLSRICRLCLVSIVIEIG